MNLHKAQEDRCFYYTYKIVSLLPDKPYYYYGIHKTKVLEDGYFGGGQRLQSTVKKYGKENFRKNILKFYENYDQLIKAEKGLVGNLYETDPWCLNLVAGGGTTHGFHRPRTEEEKRHLSEYNKVHSKWAQGNAFDDPEFRERHKRGVSSAEARRKMSESHKGTGKPMTEEQYKRHLEICRSEKWRKAVSEAAKRHVRTQEHTEHLNLALKNQKKYTCPYCGKVTTGGNFKRWHGENCKMKAYGQENN